ncbi:hypothetical protein N0V90_009858 [Kalmusia sp. IMI 367209]|nr:hypothetical protein N0V90_009858 [Kalmusia sp. IMI 367209]
MTPEDTVHLEQVIYNEMAKEAEKEETENLRLALLDKLVYRKEQVPLAPPLARAPKKDKITVQTPAIGRIGGNMDGASQSAEIVTPGKESPMEEQASIENLPGAAAHLHIETEPQSQSRLSTSLTSGLPMPMPLGDHGDNASTLSVFDEDTQKLPDEETEKLTDEDAKQLSNENTKDMINGNTNNMFDEDTKELWQTLGEAKIEFHSLPSDLKHPHSSTHLSASSDQIGSSFDSGGKPKLHRARRITNDSVLELKASPAKLGQVKSPAKQHRRKVSLKLPVNVRKPQHGPPPLKTLTPSPVLDEDTLALYEREERELEYKHRHIFIGTASLDDFLEILEVHPSTYITTKRQVTKAFGILACAEQVQARQSSISSAGWNFVTRITSDDILTRTDYLTESHVKLGSISLGKFIAKIPFDDKEEIDATKVVDAFCLASRLDGEATYGSQSKAKAFRIFMVREKGGF